MRASALASGSGLCSRLIDFLDEQGYLTDSLEEIIDHTPLEWMLDEEALQNALDVLQTFDPPGVAEPI